ncbi:MAG: T9SS type A sorting domain-containing protein [Bacteroidetes bacterium]|nr:MAG: T9SS type A sorting domain-containing protein [Bacteroidota bacterium]
MVKFSVILLWFFLSDQILSQDYTVVPVNLAAQGTPQYLFFANATIVNNSPAKIDLFMERIEKNIPANWSSCFCHPKCVAPFVDTIFFSIPPYSQDSITPSFLADSIPGIGTIRVRFFQIGYESLADTLTFTGSTLSWTSINSCMEEPEISIYPNPCSENLSILVHRLNEGYTLRLYNSTGKLMEIRKNLTEQKIIIPLKEYYSGVYFWEFLFNNGTVASKKIVITK